MVFERYVQVLETRLAKLERLIRQVHTVQMYYNHLCYSFRLDSTHRQTRWNRH